MLELTATGWAHTAFSLVSLASGIWLIARHGEIRPDLPLGRLVLGATALTALAALAIYQRGGFGPGHVLAILAIGAIGFGLVVGRGAQAGSWRHVLSALAFSFTLLCQLIPGATETLTRFPLGNPLIASVLSPELQPVFLSLVAAFVLLALYQTVRLRAVRQG